MFLGDIGSHFVEILNRVFDGADGAEGGVGSFRRVGGCAFEDNFLPAQEHVADGLEATGPERLAVRCSHKRREILRIFPLYSNICQAGVGAA